MNWSRFFSLVSEEYQGLKLVVAPRGVFGTYILIPLSLPSIRQDSSIGKQG